MVFRKERIDNYVYILARLNEFRVLIASIIPLSEECRSFC